jgi:tungstate transport system permease protein
MPEKWNAQIGLRSSGRGCLNFFTESFKVAFQLISSLDPEVFSAVWTSLFVAGWSVLVAGVIGIPIGVAGGMGTLPLNRQSVVLLNTLTALPTVVIGLLVYGFLGRGGPLGRFDLLFTSTAVIIGETIMAIPIIATYTLAVVRGADIRIIPTTLTLGGSRLRGIVEVLREVRFGVIAAVIAGFGRVISEVGAAMMLGGNIRFKTRTMTTAITLETSKGEFGFALAIGLILMAIALVTNVGLNLLQQSGQEAEARPRKRQHGRHKRARVPA